MQLWNAIFIKLLRIKLRAQLREFSQDIDHSLVGVSAQKYERNSNEVHQPDFIPFFGKLWRRWPHCVIKNLLSLGNELQENFKNVIKKSFSNSFKGDDRSQISIDGKNRSNNKIVRGLFKVETPRWENFCGF
jgi:hypothetical protein